MPAERGSAAGRPRWPAALPALALAAHLVLGALRVPKKAWRDRAAEIARYERLGPIRFHLGKAYGEATVRAVERLRATPRDSAVLFRGSRRGPIEFVPALLWPRLLYEASAVRPGARRVHGRPIARGRHGRFVLVARRRGLELVEEP